MFVHTNVYSSFSVPGLKAAQTLAASDGALHLRTLQSINDVSSDQSNTIIFTMPLEIMQAFTGYFKKNKE